MTLNFSKSTWMWVQVKSVISLNWRKLALLITAKTGTYFGFIVFDYWLPRYFSVREYAIQNNENLYEAFPWWVRVAQERASLHSCAQLRETMDFRIQQVSKITRIFIRTYATTVISRVVKTLKDTRTPKGCIIKPVLTLKTCLHAQTKPYWTLLSILFAPNDTFRRTIPVVHLQTATISMLKTNPLST